MRTPVVVAIGIIAIAVLAVLAILIGGGSSASSLTGTDWHLTAYTEATPAFQGVVPAEEQSRYTIAFADGGTFGAQADCNRVAGTYETSGQDALKLTVGPSTLVACPDGSHGGVYVHALDNADTYVIAGEQLTITLSGGGSLTYAAGEAPEVPPTPSPSPSASPSPSPSLSPSPTPSPSPSPTTAPTEEAPTAAPTEAPTTAPTAAPTEAPTAAPTEAPTAAPTAKPTAAPTAAPTATPVPGGDLTGKTWLLTAITTRNPGFQGVVPPDQQDQYTITFATAGTFAAQADCNQIAGTWTAGTSGSLTLQLGPSTIVECPDGSLGDLYVIALGNAASYAVTSGQLTITLDDGGTLAYR